MGLFYKWLMHLQQKLTLLEKITKTGGVNPLQIKKKAYFRQIDNLTSG